ncbi:hypothetical protein WR164_01600 [Philodulcilactobacillus myokoensis]|uniref:Nicotinamide mononucleotide transporter n=1 Tax=Philodulcilactobacillus myokoensis TaxID=2929573 RepID=A0A9W6AZP6_9LACO|nr:nicotinamide riboside transporter PnuC [Philodulcilactobacillus myokoensis]GLB46181.1 hypothetical protein WR164_01600 [Philodulcilactobacillus myokoensis]
MDHSTPSTKAIIKEAASLAFNPKNIIKELFHMQLGRGLYIIFLLLIQLCSFFIIYTPHHLSIAPDTTFIGLLGLFSGITGILNVTIEADGKITNYFWAILNNVSYIYISFVSYLYGEVYLNLYFLVLEFIGIYTWTAKNMKSDSETKNVVESKSLSFKGWFILIILFAISWFGMGIFLLHVPFISTTLDPHPWLDALSAIVQFYAMALMVMRYGSSQWLLWNIANMAEIILWILSFNPIMVAFYVVSLTNSIYGWYKWTYILKQN